MRTKPLKTEKKLNDVARCTSILLEDRKKGEGGRRTGAKTGSRDQSPLSVRQMGDFRVRRRAIGVIGKPARWADGRIMKQNLEVVPGNVNASSCERDQPTGALVVSNDIVYNYYIITVDKNKKRDYSALSFGGSRHEQSIARPFRFIGGSLIGFRASPVLVEFQELRLQWLRRQLLLRVGRGVFRQLDRLRSLRE